MNENQTAGNPQIQQNPNQVPVQSASNQTTSNDASISMQIQQLLVQQQQYQQQYNQLVTYVKQTPNLPIEQINQIQQQLNQLNALFVQGKQKLQTLGYTQVQVNKPVEVKTGSKFNFSFKNLALGCGLILVLFLVGFFITLVALKNNPDALTGIGVPAGNAKMLLQLFAGLLFGSVIILMLGVVVSNIYRLATVKNQSKIKHIGGLLGGLLGVAVFGVIMGLVFGEIGKIETEEQHVDYGMARPYLLAGKLQQGDIEGVVSQFRYYDGSFPLIAPSEIKFELNGNNFISWAQRNAKDVISVKLVCGNQQGQELDLNGNIGSIQNGSSMVFNGGCFYGEKGTYTYNLSAEVKTPNGINTEIIESGALNFVSEIQISQNKTRKFPTNGEFILGKVPARISIDTTQIFRDLGLGTYRSVWYLDSDNVADITDKVSFDYTYFVPQVYYPAVNFPDVDKNMYYVFPIRTEQSDVPVCNVELENLQGTTKYSIHTNFIDNSSESLVKSYSYKIINDATNTQYDILKDKGQNFTYEFPEKGSYRVVLDFITVDDKQGQCESDVIQLQKETFDVQYALLVKDSNTGKFKELCTSQGSIYDQCTNVSLDSIPQNLQLQITSIFPSYATTNKVVYLDDKTLFNDNDTYDFDINEEGVFTLKIVTSDATKGIDEETRIVTINIKKQDIVGSLTITSPETGEPIDEGFEPLLVRLDASKTEINIPGDEIVYFTWDFGDGEIKSNQQNGVVAHTYNYDYVNENGIFTPKVTIKTKMGNTKEIVSPTILNVKKGLIDIELSSTSHPTRQAKVGKNVSFQAEFDGLPESMTRDFGDGSSLVTCPTRSCAEVEHIFKNTGVFSVRLTLEFDAIQKVDSVMEFKVYE